MTALVRQETLAETQIAKVSPRARRAPLALVLLLAVTASGCATSIGEYIHNGFKVGPNYHPPAAPVSDAWIDCHDPRVISQAPPDWAWWRAFNDPVLDNLVQMASRQSITLRQAGFRVLEARAIRSEAVGELFPQTQQAFGSYERNQLSREALPVSGGIMGQPGAVRNFSLWTVGNQLAWEIDVWGKFRRAVESADASLDSSIENYDSMLVMLEADVAGAYVDIRTSEQRLRYARSNVKYQTGSLEITEAKLKGGVASRLDVTQAQTNLAQTAATIPQFEIDLRRAQNRLCVLLGVPPQDIARLLAGPERIPSAVPEVAIGIPADLLRRRPDVRGAERDVAAQSAQIGIAESELYPAFSINGTIDYQANQFSHLFRSSAMAGSVGPSFQWDILNYGRIHSRITQQDARFQQTVATYQQTVLTANREVEDAVIGFLRTQTQAKVLLEGANAAEESRNLVRDLYQNGQADFGRVFFAEFFLSQQQDALAVAQGAIANNLVNIYRALGGGWQLRCETLPPLPLPPVVAPEVVPTPKPGDAPDQRLTPPKLNDKAAAINGSGFNA